jgi:hypothetical protein
MRTIPAALRLRRGRFLPAGSLRSRPCNFFRSENVFLNLGRLRTLLPRFSMSLPGIGLAAENSASMTL